MNRCFLLLMMLCCTGVSTAQFGGSHVYKFLNVPPSARMSAMGGKLFSVRDKDPAMAILNPSMLHPDMSSSISVNMVDYFADAIYGHASYVQSFKKTGTFHFSTHFVSYGSFDGYDMYGNSTGQFSAGDFMLNIGYGRELVDSVFSMGINTKYIFSQYERYFSMGFALDWAASYYSQKHQLSLTLLLSNMGTQIIPYADKREPIPFEIQLAFSQRLKHIPVRYSIVLQHLQRWNLIHDDPEDPFLQVDAITEKPVSASKVARFGDNLIRHLVIGLEILPMKYFSLQVSYNFNTFKQMRIHQKRTVVGLAYGAGLHLYHFHFYYARSHGNLGSVPNHFTLSTNISEFFKK